MQGIDTNKWTFIGSIAEKDAKIHQLTDDYKEMKQDLDEIKTKYHTLLRKSNVKESEYVNWDSDIITDWILSRRRIP